MVFKHLGRVLDIQIISNSIICIPKVSSHNKNIIEFKIEHLIQFLLFGYNNLNCETKC